MKQREAIEVNTSENAKLPAKEPSLPVFIPMRMVRWVLYSFVFMLLLVPFVSGLRYDGAKAACGGMVLGWFASQLNALINKKP
jgi:hypothetical protein